MIQPPYLKKGDKIGIVSPARKITFEEVHPTLKLCKKWGLEAVLGTHVFSDCKQFAGTDTQRRSDLQQMMDDPSIRAVLCARGGYGTVRIIDGLDFSGFQKHPKWIAGYSDITVLHSHIHRNLNMETIHATMPVNIKDTDFQSDSVESLRKSLFGEKISYQKSITFHDKTGLMEGILTGGNLSILYSLMGSASEIDTDGKVLFIEDVDEYLYHIDRMMMNLKRAGKLKNLKGLIVGGMDRMNDNEIPFGKTANEIIEETVEEYHYPVCFDFPAGHGKVNLAMILGGKIRINVDKNVDVEMLRC
jgi:muramoyltetrapeptide carboxypeptidase